jgi:bifunctional DNA-binding transcriptional regulator/antitoxin component of YhaV-PrlF toxin-antitoxin module
MTHTSTFSVPISQKGQITIPIQIRKALGLNQHKKAMIRLTSQQQAVIEAPKYSLQDVMGAVKPIDKNFAQMRQIAKNERLDA